jgi:hypothetical protein
MVRRLLEFRDALAHRTAGGLRTDDIAGVQADAMAAVDAYFQRMLTAVPSIAAYLDSVASMHASPPTVR